MRNEHQSSFYCRTDGDLTALVNPMVRVEERDRERIQEHGRGVLKPNAMLRDIRRRFSGIPLKRQAPAPSERDLASADLLDYASLTSIESAASS